MIRAVLLFVLVAASVVVEAQQMVVMKRGGKPIARYNLGDDIRFVLKGDNQEYHAAILSIREFEFITLQKDTIRYNEIAALKFRNPGLKKYVTTTLIASASLMALHFALKGPFGDSNPQSVNGLAYVAGAGLIPLAFAAVMNRSKIKLKGYKRLRFINYDSPLYK